MARKLYATADGDGSHTLWCGQRGLIYEVYDKIHIKTGFWNVPIHEKSARYLIEEMTPAEFKRIFGTTLAPGAGPTEVTLRGEVLGK